MTPSITVIDELAEFYKHALNVAGDVRLEKCCECGTSCDCKYTEVNSPSWCGWMRCYITPYLTDNKIECDDTAPLTDLNNNILNNYKERLLYTLQDYLEYVKCIGKTNVDVTNKTNNLISNIKLLDNTDIITMIENSYTLFPTIDDAKTDDVLHEHWNELLLDM